MPLPVGGRSRTEASWRQPQVRLSGERRYGESVDVSGRPPGPVLVVLALFATTAVGCLIGVVVLTMSGRFDDTLMPLTGVCASAVVGAAVLRRIRGVRVVVVVIAAASILLAMSWVSDLGGLGLMAALPGGLVIALVTAPPSSQRWFAPHPHSDSDSRGISGSRHLSRVKCTFHDLDNRMRCDTLLRCPPSATESICW